MGAVVTSQHLNAPSISKSHRGANRGSTIRFAHISGCRDSARLALTKVL